MWLKDINFKKAFFIHFTALVVGLVGAYIYDLTQPDTIPASSPLSLFPSPGISDFLIYGGFFVFVWLVIFVVLVIGWIIGKLEKIIIK